jgi:Fic family protein
MKLKENNLFSYKNRNSEIDVLKKQIDSYRPFNKQLLNELQQFYRIGFTYSSNALEGNSLTESETKIIIEDGLTIGGKTIREHSEVLGHSEAYTYLNTLTKRNIITEHNILELHRLFYYRIDARKAGIYRKQQVYISGTDYLPPNYKEIPELMKKFVLGISELKEKSHPVTLAAKLHERIASIHPFIDGNGRTARLVMNLSLLQDGYPIVIIPPILRNEYIASIRLANTGNTEPFFDFISQVEYESSKDYLRLLKHFHGE